MNFQTGAVVAGAAFALSFLSGLIGGVPLFDLLLRALVWAVVGFGGSLGIEMLLKTMVPDLFAPAEEPPSEESSGQAINITIDEESPLVGGVVEEVDEDAPAPRARSREEPAAQTGPESPGPSPASGESADDEEMPEIGSFLDAFKPGSSGGGEDGEAASPEIGEYAPVDSGSSQTSRSSEVTIDGEVQDPVILAKAVQTVLKRDAQGN